MSITDPSRMVTQDELNKLRDFIWNPVEPEWDMDYDADFNEEEDELEIWE